jgi:hypothetical protein
MVAFRAASPKGFVAYVVRAAGGSPHRVCSNCGRITDWSPDNRKVILHDFGAKAGKVGLVDLQSGEQRVLMESATRIYAPHVSPDGRWVAFSTETAGFVAPYHEDRTISESEWIPLSQGEGTLSFVQWAPGSRRLFWLGGAYRSIWTAPFDPATGKPAGASALVFRPPVSHSLGGDESAAALALAGDRLYFSMYDLHSNIGIAEIDARQ